MTFSAHTTAPVSGHPIPEAVARLHETLDVVVETDASELDAETCLEVLAGLARVADRVDELRARVLGRADDIAAFPGRSFTRAYADALGIPHRDALAQLRLVRLLRRHARVRQALACGLVTGAQARAIAEAVDALPPAAADWVRTEALEHLLTQAPHFDAADLARLGRHVLEVVDPAAGEAELARRLAAEEQAAAAKTMLVMSDDGHGLTHGRFRIPSGQGQALRAALVALVAARRSAASVPAGAPEPAAGPRPSAKELGVAFCEHVAGAGAGVGVETDPEPEDAGRRTPDEPVREVIVPGEATMVADAPDAMWRHLLVAPLRWVVWVLHRTVRRGHPLDLAHTNPIQRT